MQKHLIILLLLSIFAVSACSVSNKANPNQCKEDITKFVKENPSLGLDAQLKKYCEAENFDNFKILVDDYGYKNEIAFEHENIAYKRVYIGDLIDVMNWLKDSTPKDAKITAWWDYGGMIKVFAERVPLALSPSKDAAKFTSDYIVDKSLSRYPKLEDDTKIKNIARIYTTHNSSEAIQIMRDYGTNYLLVPVEINGKFPIIYELAYGEFKLLKDSDSQSITYKALNNQPIVDFKLVYSDDSAAVYELIV